MAFRKFDVGKGEFESVFGDIEVIGILTRTVKGEFAKSLVDNYNERSRLSDKQWAWAHKLAMDSVKSDMGLPYDEVEALSHAVISMTPKTRISLKSPFSVIKIQVEEYEHKVYYVGPFPAQIVTFSIAGYKAKFPGSIQCTDGKPYGEDRWYGRIVEDNGLSDLAIFITGVDASKEVINFIRMFAEDPELVCVSYNIF